MEVDYNHSQLSVGKIQLPHRLIKYRSFIVTVLIFNMHVKNLIEYFMIGQNGVLIELRLYFFKEQK